VRAWLIAWGTEAETALPACRPDHRTIFCTIGNQP